ncbi:MAG: hypothetical protein QG622_196 [Actinomycetota bacterium]|nr:hypothetical protein [Actinomycetota bacterium]
MRRDSWRLEDECVFHHDPRRSGRCSGRRSGRRSGSLRRTGVGTQTRERILRGTCDHLEVIPRCREYGGCGIRQPDRDDHATLRVPGEPAGSRGVPQTDVGDRFAAADRGREDLPGGPGDGPAGGGRGRPGHCEQIAGKEPMPGGEVAPGDKDGDGARRSRAQRRQRAGCGEGEKHRDHHPPVPGEEEPQTQPELGTGRGGDHGEPSGERGAAVGGQVEGEGQPVEGVLAQAVVIRGEIRHDGEQHLFESLDTAPELGEHLCLGDALP